MPTERPEQFRDPNYMHPSKRAQVRDAPREAPPPNEDTLALLAYMILEHSPDKEESKVVLPLDKYESMDFHGRSLVCYVDQTTNQLIVTVS